MVSIQVVDYIVLEKSSHYLKIKKSLLTGKETVLSGHALYIIMDYCHIES